MAIPRSAVLWSGHTSRVHVKKAAGSYQQRDVKLGKAGDVCWEVLDGLEAGERVVVAGNMSSMGRPSLTNSDRAEFTKR